MVYGELGTFPLELQTKIKMICFWNKLVSSEKYQKVSIEDLLEWLNYIFFCRGHTERFELSLPILYDSDKNHH
jgi:hypothetical protein